MCYGKSCVALTLGYNHYYNDYNNYNHYNYYNNAAKTTEK